MLAYYYCLWMLVNVDEIILFIKVKVKQIMIANRLSNPALRGLFAQPSFFFSAKKKQI